VGLPLVFSIPLGLDSSPRARGPGRAPNLLTAVVEPSVYPPLQSPPPEISATFSNLPAPDDAGSWTGVILPLSRKAVRFLGGGVCRFSGLGIRKASGASGPLYEELALSFFAPLFFSRFGLGPRIKDPLNSRRPRHVFLLVCVGQARRPVVFGLCSGRCTVFSLRVPWPFQMSRVQPFQSWGHLPAAFFNWVVQFKPSIP